MRSPVALRAARGAAFTIGSGVLTRLLGLVGTLILVRHVAPEAYGEVQAAVVIVFTANHLSTLGLGLYLVARPKAGRAVAFHVTVMHVGLGLAAVVVLCLGGPQLGATFAVPGLPRYLPGLAVTMMLDRLAFTPERVLVRQLRFGAVSLARGAAEVAYTVVSVATAVAGWGAASVVVGGVARSSARLAVLIPVLDWREWLEPHRLRRRTMAVLARYGVVVSASGVAGYGARRWDNLVVASLFGSAVLGPYNLAYNLADLPATTVGEAMTDVLLASFAHLPPGQRRAALVHTMGLLALVVFPLAVGLGAIAPALAHVLFAGPWLEVGPMLMILSGLAVPRPLGDALCAYLYAIDRPRAVLAVQWASVVMLLGAVAALGTLGPRWPCVGVGVGFGLRTVLALAVVRRTDPVPVGALVRALVRPLAACVPLLGGVVAACHGLAAAGLDRSVPGVMVEVLAGAVGYGVGTLLCARGQARQLIALLRDAFGERAARRADHLATGGGGRQ